MPNTNEYAVITQRISQEIKNKDISEKYWMPVFLALHFFQSERSCPVISAAHPIKFWAQKRLVLC